MGLSSSSWEADVSVLENELNPIQYDLDRFPLEIVMDSSEPRGVWLKGRVDATTPPFPEREDTRFSLAWRQEDKSVWLAFHHTGFGEETMGGQACWTDMSWRVLKLKRKLVLICHNNVAYEVHYKDLYDSTRQQRSIKDLTKSVTHIWFDDSSTVLRIKQLGALFRDDEHKCVCSYFSKFPYLIATTAMKISYFRQIIS